VKKVFSFLKNTLSKLYKWASPFHLTKKEIFLRKNLKPHEKAAFCQSFSFEGQKLFKGKKKKLFFQKYIYFYNVKDSCHHCS